MGLPRQYIKCSKHGRQRIIPTLNGKTVCAECYTSSMLKCPICSMPYIKMNKDKEWGEYKPACKHNKNLRISVG